MLHFSNLVNIRFSENIHLLPQKRSFHVLFLIGLGFVKLFVEINQKKLLGGTGDGCV